MRNRSNFHDAVPRWRLDLKNPLALGWPAC